MHFFVLLVLTVLTLIPSATPSCDSRIISTSPGDTILTASSEFAAQISSQLHGASRGVLNYTQFTSADGKTYHGAWTAAINNHAQYIQVQLKREYEVTGVITQGRNGCCLQWVKKYKILYGDDCNHLKVLDSGNGPDFNGNSDEDTMVTNTFPTSVKARCIRIQPTDWNNQISMRVDIIGCLAQTTSTSPSSAASSTTSTPLATTTVAMPSAMSTKPVQQQTFLPGICSSNLLTGNNTNLTSTITASSTKEEKSLLISYHADRAVLFSTEETNNTKTRYMGGWSPDKTDKNQFVQIEFSKPTVIRGIVTQGKNGCCDKWVTKYIVQYSEDCKTWTLSQSGAVPQVYQANTDKDTPVTQVLYCPHAVKCIRIQPIEWHNDIGMRFELVGCQIQNGGVPIATKGGTNQSSQTTAYLTTSTTPSVKLTKNGPLPPPGQNCNQSLFGSGQNGIVMSSSSERLQPDQSQDYSADRGRLHSTETQTIGRLLHGGWSAANLDTNQFIQVKLPQLSSISGIVTQGKDGPGQEWVTKFRVLYSGDCKNWHVVPPMNGGQFIGNTDENTEVTNMFSRTVQALCIKINPSVWNKHISLRMDLIGCFNGSNILATKSVMSSSSTSPTAFTIASLSTTNSGSGSNANGSLCHNSLLNNQTLGPEVNISASSMFHNPTSGTMPSRALLDTKTETNQQFSMLGGWSPAGDKNQYIQASFSSPHMIQSIVTQGMDSSQKWVTKYTVEYSEDCINWQPVQRPKEFLANSDDSTKVTNDLGCPVFAKCVRIHPLEWHQHIGLRFDLVGCAVKDSSHPPFQQSTVSTVKPTTGSSSTIPTTQSNSVSSTTISTLTTTKPLTPSTTISTPSTTKSSTTMSTPSTTKSSTTMSTSSTAKSSTTMSTPSTTKSSTTMSTPSTTKSSTSMSTPSTTKSSTTMSTPSTSKPTTPTTTTSITSTAASKTTPTTSTSLTSQKTTNVTHKVFPTGQASNYNSKDPIDCKRALLLDPCTNPIVKMHCFYSCNPPASTSIAPSSSVSTPSVTTSIVPSKTTANPSSSVGSTHILSSSSNLAASSSNPTISSNISPSTNTQMVTAVMSTTASASSSLSNVKSTQSLKSSSVLLSITTSQQLQSTSSMQTSIIPSSTVTQMPSSLLTTPTHHSHIVMPTGQASIYNPLDPLDCKRTLLKYSCSVPIVAMHCSHSCAKPSGIVSSSVPSSSQLSQSLSPSISSFASTNSNPSFSTQKTILTSRSISAQQSLPISSTSSPQSSIRITSSSSMVIMLSKTSLFSSSILPSLQSNVQSQSSQSSSSMVNMLSKTSIFSSSSQPSLQSNVQSQFLQSGIMSTQMIQSSLPGSLASQTVMSSHLTSSVQSSNPSGSLSSQTALSSHSVSSNHISNLSGSLATQTMQPSFLTSSSQSSIPSVILGTQTVQSSFLTSSAQNSKLSAGLSSQTIQSPMQTTSTQSSNPSTRISSQMTVSMSTSVLSSAQMSISSTIAPTATVSTGLPTSQFLSSNSLSMMTSQPAASAKQQLQSQSPISSIVNTNSQTSLGLTPSSFLLNPSMSSIGITSLQSMSSSNQIGSSNLVLASTTNFLKATSVLSQILPSTQMPISMSNSMFLNLLSSSNMMSSQSISSVVGHSSLSSVNLIGSSANIVTSGMPSNSPMATNAFAQSSQISLSSSGGLFQTSHSQHSGISSSLHLSSQLSGMISQLGTHSISSMSHSSVSIPISSSNKNFQSSMIYSSMPSNSQMSNSMQSFPVSMASLIPVHQTLPLSVSSSVSSNLTSYVSSVSQTQSSMPLSALSSNSLSSSTSSLAFIPKINSAISAMASSISSQSPPSIFSMSSLASSASPLVPSSISSYNSHIQASSSMSAYQSQMQSSSNGLSSMPASSVTQYSSQFSSNPTYSIAHSTSMIYLSSVSQHYPLSHISPSSSAMFSSSISLPATQTMPLSPTSFFSSLQSSYSMLTTPFSSTQVSVTCVPVSSLLSGVGTMSNSQIQSSSNGLLFSSAASHSVYSSVLPLSGFSVPSTISPSFSVGSSSSFSSQMSSLSPSLTCYTIHVPFSHTPSNSLMLSSTVSSTQLFVSSSLSTFISPSLSTAGSQSSSQSSQSVSITSTPKPLTSPQPTQNQTVTHVTHITIPTGVASIYDNRDPVDCKRTLQFASCSISIVAMHCHFSCATKPHPASPIGRLTVPTGSSTGTSLNKIFFSSPKSTRNSSYISFTKSTRSKVITITSTTSMPSTSTTKALATPNPLTTQSSSSKVTTTTQTSTTTSTPTSTTQRPTPKPWYDPRDSSQCAQLISWVSCSDFYYGSLCKYSCVNKMQALG